MNEFVSALKQGNLEKIRACPKSDLHNHFVLGGSRRYLRQRTGIKIEPVKRPLSSMDEMHAWNRGCLSAEELDGIRQNGLSKTV